MNDRTKRRMLTGAAVAGALPVALSPAQALGKSAQLRLVHAMPGMGEGRLSIKDGAAVEHVATASYGKVTHYTTVAPGSVQLLLSPAGTDKSVTTARAHLRDHARYTAVAMAPKKGAMTKVRLLVLRDGNAKPGTSLLRVVHAAPELGSPNLELDGKTVAKAFPFGAVSPYLDVPPGKHDVKAMKTGDSMPLLSLNGLTFKAGTAATAIVVGTRGEPVKAVLATDDTLAAPKAKPVKAKIKTTSQRSGAGVHVVRRGECLWTIAAQHLGSGASNAAVQRELVRIWNRNAAKVPSGDPDVIQPGLRLDVS